MVLGGCQVRQLLCVPPPHEASRCLDKQNLLHRGRRALLRHLKSRKLPLQHRQALGIFCWIIFSFPGYPSQLACVFWDFCSSLGGPRRLVWWPDQLIDQPSDLGAELTPCSSPAPGFWTVIMVDLTYSRASEDWTGGRGGGASLFLPRPVSNEQKSHHSASPLVQILYHTQRRPLSIWSQSVCYFDAQMCVCVCVCVCVFVLRGGEGLPIQKYFFSGIGVEARELWKAKLFPKTSHSKGTENNPFCKSCSASHPVN